MSEELKDTDVEPTEPTDKKEPKQKGEEEPAWLNKLMDKLDNVLPTGNQTDQGAQQVPVPNPPPPPEPEDEEDHLEPKTKNPLQKVLDWLM